MKFQSQSHDLQLWPWPAWLAHGFCKLSHWGEHLTKLKCHPRVTEIWRGHEIQSLNLWPSTVTLSYGVGVWGRGHGWVMNYALHLTEVNISPKINENLSKGSETWSGHKSVMDRLTDLQTEEEHSYNPLSLCDGGLMRETDRYIFPLKYSASWSASTPCWNSLDPVT